jgi:hAT family C-terminal dimerisation region
MVGGEWLYLKARSSYHDLSIFFSQFNYARYHPAWASLARDYLSIMSSSVSSERAFSQGGITITKRRNRLKEDIVEALQCVKCAVRHDLLFREPAPSSTLEVELNADGEDEEDGEVREDTGSGELERSEAAECWNDVLMEDEDEGSGMDIYLD